MGRGPNIGTDSSGALDPRTSRDVALAKVESRAEIGRIVAYGIMAALCIATCALPIFALQGAIHDLAGKTTTVEANVIVSVSLTISFVINGLQFAKIRIQ